jgi:F0F1-type ATP synthase membrane subunit b/b'
MVQNRIAAAFLLLAAIMERLAGPSANGAYDSSIDQIEARLAKAARQARDLPCAGWRQIRSTGIAR